MDFILLDDEGEIRVWLQDNNTGLFNSPIIEHLVSSTNDWMRTDIHNRLWLVNYNNDQYMDFVGLHADGTIIVWLQNGSNNRVGGYDIRELLVGDTNKWLNTELHRRLWITDHNGDGDADVIGIADDGDVVIWMQNNTTGLLGNYRVKEHFVSNATNWLTRYYHFRF